MKFLLSLPLLVAALTIHAAEPAATFSSFDRPAPGDAEEKFPAGTLKFENADLADALKSYQQISKRAVIRSGSLAAPPISFNNEHAVTRREALQALDTVLAENGIVMIPLGTRYVKAVTVKQAPSEPAPVVELPASQLPESSSYLIYIVELKQRRPSEVLRVIQPFARMPNSIMASDADNLLVLRDYSVNVRRMLQMIEKMEGAPARQ